MSLLPSESALLAKKDYVSSLAEKIRDADVGVLVSYKGIDVQHDTKLRSEMRDAGVDYFVAKNSMLRFAFEEVGLNLDGYLCGATSLALAKGDPILVSKILTKYVKELSQDTTFSIKAGFIKGDVVGGEVIEEYGSLPSRDELLAMLLGLLLSPVRGFAVALKAVADKLSAEGKE